MRNVFIVVALLSMTLSNLSGCAYIYSRTNNVAEKIDSLAKQKNYGLALKILSYVDKDHFNYVFLMSEKKRITAIAKKYEKNSIIEAESYAKKKQWALAMSSYDTALKNLPESIRIKKSRAKFIIKRDKYLKQLENKLLVSSAKTLSKKTATTKEIAQVIPENQQAKKRLSSHIKEVKLTANKLLECTEDSINNKDFQLAEECLSLASNLSDSKATDKKVTLLQRRIESYKNKQQKSQSKSILKLSKNLSQINSNQELIRYQQEISQYYLLNKSDRKAIKLKKELDEKIKLTLQSGIKQGQDLYSQGRIKPALTLWNELYQLDSGNTQLNDYIHRAEKVLKKIQSLSSKPNSLSLPKNKAE